MDEKVLADRLITYDTSQDDQPRATATTPSGPRRPDRTRLLGAQQRDIGQAVPAQPHRERQIRHDLRWVVHGQRLAPARQPRR